MDTPTPSNELEDGEQRTSLESSLKERKNVRITDVRKQSLFDMVDYDKSGTIDQSEFDDLNDVVREQTERDVRAKMTAEKKALSAKRQVKVLGCSLFVLFTFLAMSVAANFAAMFYVVDEQVKTTTASTGKLQVKGSDAIVKTAKAMDYVPLIVAPVLDMDTLEAVDVLTVTIKAHTHPSPLALALKPQHLKGDNASNTTNHSLVARGTAPEPDIIRKYSITGFDWVSRTRMTFITSRGDEIHIRNGRAYVVTAAGVQHEVCAALATCSAFKAGGFDVSTKLIEAFVALRPVRMTSDVMGNMTSETTSDRRKLAFSNKYTKGFKSALSGATGAASGTLSPEEAGASIINNMLASGDPWIREWLDQMNAIYEAQQAAAATAQSAPDWRDKQTAIKQAGDDTGRLGLDTVQEAWDWLSDLLLGGRCSGDCANLEMSCEVALQVAQAGTTSANEARSYEATGGIGTATVTFERLCDDGSDSNTAKVRIEGSVALDITASAEFTMAYEEAGKPIVTSWGTVQTAVTLGISATGEIPLGTIKVPIVIRLHFRKGNGVHQAEVTKADVEYEVVPELSDCVTPDFTLSMSIEVAAVFNGFIAAFAEAGRTYTIKDMTGSCGTNFVDAGITRSPPGFEIGCQVAGFPPKLPEIGIMRRITSRACSGGNFAMPALTQCASPSFGSRFSYIAFDEGPSCPDAAAITTETECETAAMGIGYSRKVLSGSWSHAPRGCHVETWGTGVYLNGHPVGTAGRANYRTLCKAFAVLENGPRCQTGEITTVKECNAAAASLGHNTPVVSGSYSWAPKGCHVETWGPGSYLNSYDGTVGRENYKTLCRVMPYRLLDNGPRCDYGELQTAAECKMAATALGYTSAVVTGSYSWAPKGCHVETWGTGVYYNYEAGTTGRENYKTICAV